MTQFSRRPTFANVSLEDLRFNFRSCREFIGQDQKYMAVVKANAYGHGAVECSRALIDEGAEWLAVAIVEEAVELRDADIDAPILCLGGVFKGQEGTALDLNVTPVIFNIEQAASMSAAASVRGGKAAIHIKVDTGMGRLGIRWHDLDRFIDRLSSLDNLTIQGVMSHFASANDPAEDGFTSAQMDRFFEAVTKFEDAGFAPEIIHIANSPASIGHPSSRVQMVRLGGILYGLGRDVLNQRAPKPELRPVMSLCSEIADIKFVPQGETLGYGRTFVTERDSRIALIPVGYNDGYARALSNRASVLVRGVRVPVTGLISMDWTIIDVTDVPDPLIGDRVTLIGSDGIETIVTEDLAREAGTISYEITCGISARVPRRFIE